MMSIASIFFFSAKTQIEVLVGVAERGKLVTARHHIFQSFYTSTFSKFRKFTPIKRVKCNILNLEYYIFGVFIHLIGIVSQFSYAHFTCYNQV